MIYFGSRSPLKYLRKVEEVAGLTEPHLLLSITGGLVVLHAIGTGCKSLTLVDHDPEVNAHARAILELLSASETMQQFFGVLTGSNLIELGDGQFAFSGIYDERMDRFLALSGRSKQMIYTTYLKMTFDAASGDGYLDNSTIHFLSTSNETYHFNWLLGFGAFKSNAAYGALRERFSRIPVTVIDSALEDYDYKSISRTTLVLASNSDSPLFTKGDLVLRAIQRADNPLVYYISKTRDFFSGKLLTFQLSDLAELSRKAVFAGLSTDEASQLLTLGVRGHSDVSDENLLSHLRYDEPLLACSISRKSKGPAVEKVIQFLQEDLPVHQLLAVFSDETDDSELSILLPKLCPPYAVVHTQTEAGTTLSLLELYYRYSG